MSSGDGVQGVKAPENQAQDLEATMAERAVAVRAGDDALLALAKEMLTVSHANEQTFWATAEKQRLERGTGVDAAPQGAAEWKRPAGVAARELLGAGGDLARAGVRASTLWDGPFDLEWIMEAVNEVGGLAAAPGHEIMRSADPTDDLRQVVLVGSAEEGLARAQFDPEMARRRIFVAVRGDLTPATQARLARTLGAIVGRVRQPPGIEVEAAFPATAEGVAKAKAARLCVPAGAAWVPVVPPGGRRSWSEALAVMDAGRTDERERQRGKDRNRGLGLVGPGQAS